MTKKVWLSAAGVLILAAGVPVPAQNTEAKLEAGAQFSMLNRPATNRGTRFDLGDTVIWTGSVQIFPFFPELPGAVRIRTGTTNDFN